MNANPVTDQLRAEFLLALDASPEVTVTDWEAGFIESFLKRPDARTATFSPKERKIIDALRDKYGDPE